MESKFVANYKFRHKRHNKQTAIDGDDDGERKF